jgi:RNA polymerase sigma-70 factor (ECF subfamily)
MATESTTRDPHVLLEHTAWLRRLAMSLVRDAAAADDLVQDTWVAALRQPPNSDRPLRPWLRRVIENAARFRWRGDKNRAAREERAVVGVTAGGGDATPSSEELLARHETQRLLARLVGELDEPYRSTILLRYAEGLEPTEIADRLGVPAGTVRWRLKTALDRLRERLDGAHDGDRRAWMVALGSLAAPGNGAGALSGADAAGRGSNAATASGGGSTWPMVALAVCASLIAAVIALAVGARPSTSRRATEGSRASVHSAVIVHDAAPSQQDAYARLREIAAGTPPGWIAQEGVAPKRVAGRVVDGGKPAVGVLVRLTSELTLSGFVPALEQTTDADGRFDFGEQVARELAVGASAPGRLAAILRIDLRHPSPHTPSDALELALLPCTAALYGVVKDAGGSPIAHASIHRENVIGAEADADGHYELCVLPSAALIEQLRVVVRADGYGTVAIEAAPSGRVHRDIVLTPEAVIAGRVVDEHGAPVALAQVSVEPDPDARLPPSEQLEALVVVSDDDGRFRIEGVQGGRHRVAAAARGLTSRRQSLLVAPGATADILVTMAATGRVRGRVLLDGQPVAGATVRVRGELSDSAISQPDGTFLLDRVPAGEITLTARPYDVKTPATIAISGGAETEVVLDVAAMASIRGSVTRRGAPVPYARVDFNGKTPSGVHADGTGRYFVEGLAPGRYGYYADDMRRGAFTTGRDVVIAEGESRVLDIELANGARVRGVVVDGEGRAVAEAFVRVSGPGSESRCVTDATGVFECAAMKGGGAYTPRVYATDDATAPYPFVGPAPADVVLVDGDADVDGLRLVVDPRRLAITGIVRDAACAPVADARVRAWGPDGRRDRWASAPGTVTDVDGAFTISSLAPETYALEVTSVDGAIRARREVEAGASGVVLVVERPTCTDPSNGARVRTEPPGITMRPPGRVVWGEGEEDLELVGWDAPATVKRGEPFTITTYYRVLSPLDRAWATFIHIDGDNARHQADHEPLGRTCPSSTWQPGDFIVDRVTSTPDPARVPAGRYAIWLGFYTGWAPDWRNFDVYAAPAAMRDTTGRIKIADLIIE